MQQSYMGIDIGGESGTWMCVLKPNGDTLTVVESPRVASLEEIVQYAERYQVTAVAIDSQLTWTISDERGFRP